MSVHIDPNKPVFGESQWITSEDVNVEHLLDVFTTIDASSDDIWVACPKFIRHLFWHKGRFTILRPKIEGLPDDHRSKPKCLFELSQLLQSGGKQVERKRLLTHTLKLWKERGNECGVAGTLQHLSDVNRIMGLYKEGVQQVKEASGIFKRIGNTVAQGECLIVLGLLLDLDNQLDAAEEAAFCAINLFSGKGQRHHICQSHRLLGNIYRSKGEIEKAVHHFEVALGIASPSNWHEQLVFLHYALAETFLNEGRFRDAQAHIKCAKLHALNHTYFLGDLMELQAKLWYKQDRLEEARSGALRAVDVFEKLGAIRGLERCSGVLQWIEGGMSKPVIPNEPTDGSEFLV